MNLEEAKAILRKAQKETPTEQKSHATGITEAFRVFMAGFPTEDEFADYLEGVLLTARMLHIAVAGR